MNLCSNDHDEVCYEGRLCPACEVKPELGETQDELAKAETRISELETEIDNLQSEK